MVALAAGSSSRSTEISYQTKITAVMLGRFVQGDASELTISLHRVMAKLAPPRCGAFFILFARRSDLR